MPKGKSKRSYLPCLELSFCLVKDNYVSIIKLIETTRNYRRFQAMSTASYSDTVKIENIEYEAEFEVEPAQRGGMTDPSHDAHIYDLAVMLDGKLIKPEDIDSDGFDHTELYSDVEKVLNANMVRR
jgi:hypothetical protein